jgi:Carboxypeptidase regulatory-like domain
MKSLAGRLAAAFALLLVGTAGCNSDSLPPAAGYASVNGTIVDAATNAPISGAVVTLDTVLTATSDATGRFSFDKVPSGIADYVVAATGYQSVTSSATIEPGKPFTLTLTLSTQAKPPY